MDDLSPYTPGGFYRLAAVSTRTLARRLLRSLVLPTFFVAAVVLPTILRAQLSPSPGPAPDLSAWLAAHPAVADAFVWQDADGAKHYKDWTREQKELLRQCFTKAWRGEPNGLADPLPNALDAGADGYVRQGLSEADATALYFATAGSCLAFELRHSAPWSITQYNALELGLLFDSYKTFVRNPQKGTAAPVFYEIDRSQHGDSLPAPPEVALAFLRRHSLIGKSDLDTVSRTLEWCYGLMHFTGLQWPYNMHAHWQYVGFVPVSRVISGTYYDDGKGKRDSLPKHYTAGCHGTTGFLRNVLRCVNIPVVNLHNSGHSQPYFPTLGEYMAHGDDPYDMSIRTMQPKPAGSQLFIDGARYQQWFGAGVTPDRAEINVGRRDAELIAEVLPAFLLCYYLDDQRQRKSHADGDVMRVLRPLGSVEQMEAQGIWTRMDARIAELGGEDKVRALKKQLYEASINHALEQP